MYVCAIIILLCYKKYIKYQKNVNMNNKFNNYFAVIKIKK